MKKCSKCKKNKPLNKFHRNPFGKNGVNAQCKDCRSKYQKEYKKKCPTIVTATKKRYQDKNKKRNIELRKKGNSSINKEKSTKRCCICKKRKPKDKFHPSLIILDGYRTECKECGIKLRHKYLRKIDPNYKPREHNRKYIKNRKIIKKCGRCKEIKAIKQFHKSKTRADGYKYTCIKCNEILRQKGLKKTNPGYKPRKYNRVFMKKGIKIKKCSSCKRTKNIKLFYKHKRSHDGYTGDCKKCHSAYRQTERYKQKRKESLKIYNLKPETKILQKKQRERINKDPVRKQKYIQTAKKAYKQHMVRLEDGYIKGVICKDGILQRSDIPKELIMLKREQLKLYRLINNLKKGKSNEKCKRA